MRHKKDKNNLKSNMDRFIASDEILSMFYELHLKSNMDRFIDAASSCSSNLYLFKIQYG